MIVINYVGKPHSGWMPWFNMSGGRCLKLNKWTSIDKKSNFLQLEDYSNAVIVLLHVINAVVFHTLTELTECHKTKFTGGGNVRLLPAGIHKTHLCTCQQIRICLLLLSCRFGAILQVAAWRRCIFWLNLENAVQKYSWDFTRRGSKWEPPPPPPPILNM